MRRKTTRKRVHGLQAAARPIEIVIMCSGRAASRAVGWRHTRLRALHRSECVGHRSLNIRIEWFLSFMSSTRILTRGLVA